MFRLKVRQLDDQFKIQLIGNATFTHDILVAEIHLHLPVVVGAANATELIADGEVVTVDSRRGIVYHGASNAL